MNDIKIFKNDSFGEVRVAGTSDEPLFCLADVAKSLGYSNPAKAVIDHCKGVTVLETPTTGGVQLLKYGKEGEVYRLVMKSKLPNAEQFQDWVCEEVLPSIRKHGAYMTEQTLEKALTSPDFLIELATKLKEEQCRRIKAENEVEAARIKIKADAPKVLFADAVIGSKSSCLVGELAKLICQNGIDVGEKRLYKWLRQNHYVGTAGERYNIPNQQYIEQGLFEIKEGTRSGQEGVMHITKTTKVTGKGQEYFVNGFLTGRFKISE